MPQLSGRFRPIRTHLDGRPPQAAAPGGDRPYSVDDYNRSEWQPKVCLRASLQKRYARRIKESRDDCRSDTPLGRASDHGRAHQRWWSVTCGRGCVNAHSTAPGGTQRQSAAAGDRALFYYDGVHGWSGVGRRVTPMIEPEGRFVVRFTPPRTGTFIYHTHLHDYRQLSSGLYGPLIVVDAGETYDPLTDHVIVFGGTGLASAEPSILTDPESVVINGERSPQLVWKAGRASSGPGDQHHAGRHLRHLGSHRRGTRYVEDRGEGWRSSTGRRITQGLRTRPLPSERRTVRARRTSGAQDPLGGGARAQRQVAGAGPGHHQVMPLGVASA